MRSVPHRVVCLLGLDDGDFPRRARRDGDDLLLASRTSATATRAPRTASCCSTRCWRQRAADHHLHRQRRAHQRAAPAGGPGRRAARRGRPHRPRPRPPAPAPRAGRRSAIRCSRSTRATSSPGELARRAAVELRRAGAGRRAGADGHAHGSPAAVPAGAAAAPARARRSSSTTSCAFVEHPVRAFLRQRLGISVSELRRRGRGRAAGRARRARAVGRRPAPARRRARRRRAAARACGPRSRAGTLPPGALARRSLARDLAAVGACIAAARGRRSAAPSAPDRSTSTSRLPDGRTLTGTVAGVCGDMLRCDLLLAAQAARTGCARGCGCWR